MIEIVSDRRTETGVYFTLRTRKTSATISRNRLGVQVVKHNASHRVWKGLGRNFPDFESALAGYKSADMRTLIRSAEALSKESA
jgi:hypothetical protein